MVEPPYKVPTMAEISALPWNGLRVASTFSGCGGNCLGFRLAGFRVVWASEFIPAAAATYRLNHPTTILDTRDIRAAQPADILTATGLKIGELDVLDGSPPCSSFSMAGKREKLWGKAKAYSDGVIQRTDDLFPEFARILKGLQPRAFVAENVSDLVRGTAKGFFLEILAMLKGCGYRVRCQVVNAAWLGVPQARRRVIFVGTRIDLGRDPIFPKPMTPQYTLADALAATAGQPIEPDTDIGKYAIAKQWDIMRPGEQSEKYFQLVRPAINKPCPTVTATAGNPGAASVVHPLERRKFSVAELKAICGFPADFLLTGTYTQKVERLGRAVPPVMMSHIAHTLEGILK